MKLAISYDKKEECSYNLLGDQYSLEDTVYLP